MQDKKWPSLLATQLCACASMPLVMIGFRLARSYNIYSWMQILLYASLISVLLAYCMIKAIKNRPFTSAELFTETLGYRYSKIISYTMASVSIVWLIVHMQFIEELFKQLVRLSSKSVRLLSTLTLFLSTFIIQRGTKVLVLLAYAAVGLLVLISWNMYTTNIPTSFIEKSEISILPAITLVLIINSFNIYNTATYYQKSKSAKDSMIASGLLYGICIPLIATVGYLLSTIFPKAENLQACCTYTTSALVWSLIVFLVLSGHGNIFNNLYNASQSIKKVLPLQLKEKEILISAIAACVILFTGFTKNLISAVNLVNIPINAIGSIIIGKELFNIKTSLNIFAITLGASSLGFLSYMLLPYEELSFVITMASSYGLLIFTAKKLSDPKEK
jgi:hypothetical protein